jgi:iron complex outermembrane receptor protein
MARRRFSLGVEGMGATAIATVMGLMAFQPAVAHVSMTQQEILAAARAYAIPRGSIALALTQLADESGVRMIYRTRLTKDLTTPGLTGTYTLNEALDTLLSGTGLGYKVMEDGRAVAIVLAQADNGARSDAGAEALPPIDVGAEGAHADAGTRAGGRSTEAGGRFTGYKVELKRPATAFKTNVPLIQTPAAVQVVPREVLDDQQITGLRDALLNNVSSVSVGLQFYDQFLIRGFDVGANIYRNNLRQTSVTQTETANLQSIEIVKGPAAMLFGRIEPGGLVNLVPKRPLLTPYYSVQEQAGSFGFTRTSVDATGPLTEDKTLAYRFNGVFLRNDSFRDSVTNQNAFLAPTISYQPSEQFRLNIDGEYQTSVFVDDYDAGLVAIGKSPARIPISRYLQDSAVTVAHPTRQERYFIGYDWTFDIASNWRLTNRFGYSSTDYNQFASGLTSVNEATGDVNRNLWVKFQNRSIISANLDLTGDFTTGPLRHRTLVGADYFDWTHRAHGHQGPSPLVGPINIYNPIYNGVGLSGYTRDMDNAFDHNRELWSGIYAQDQISIFDELLQVLVGGRYDWAETSRGFSSQSAQLAAATISTSTDKAFSPKVGAVIHPLPWLSFYGSFSQSFGVTNALPAAGQPPFPPQKGTQYEGGAKAELFDGRVSATLAYYDIVKTNILARAPGSLYATPIGTVRSEGVEVDVAGRIDDNWSMIGNFSHDEARVIKDSTAAGGSGNTGKRMMNVPRNAGSLWVKYDAGGIYSGLSLGTGVVAVGERQGDPSNSFQLPGYARVDAFAIYCLPLTWGTVTAQINVKNLFNTTYYEGAYYRTIINPGAPRSFLASLRLEF